MEKQYKAFELEINALGFYINRTFFAMVKMLNAKLKENNLEIQHAEFSIIKILIELKSASQSQIATILGKERSGISRSLAVLEDKGYIIREPLDGKSNSVTLSEKGKSKIPVIEKVIEEVTHQGFKGFSQKAQMTMIRNLNKIFQNASEVD